MSLRTEYRGLVYGAPDFGLKSLHTSAVTHTAQPSVGITFHFEEAGPASPHLTLSFMARRLSSLCP